MNTDVDDEKGSSDGVEISSISAFGGDSEDLRLQSRETNSNYNHIPTRKFSPIGIRYTFHVSQVKFLVDVTANII